MLKLILISLLSSLLVVPSFAGESDEHEGPGAATNERTQSESQNGEIGPQRLYAEDSSCVRPPPVAEDGFVHYKPLPKDRIGLSNEKNPSFTLLKAPKKEEGFEELHSRFADNRAGRNSTLLESEVLVDVPPTTRQGYPTGVMLYLHGDTAGDFNGPYWEKVKAAARRHGLMAVAVKAPVMGSDAPNVSPSWWQNSQTKARYMKNLLDSLARSYPIDKGRMIFSGASGGSTFLGSEFLPAFGGEYRGGLVSMCGGYLSGLNQGAASGPHRKHFDIELVSSHDDFLLRYLGGGATEVNRRYKAMGYNSELDVRQGSHCQFGRPMFDLVNLKMKKIFRHQGDRCSLPAQSASARKLDEILATELVGLPGRQFQTSVRDFPPSSRWSSLPRPGPVDSRPPRAEVHPVTDTPNAELPKPGQGKVESDKRVPSPEAALEKVNALEKDFQNRLDVLNGLPGERTEAEKKEIKGLTDDLKDLARMKTDLTAQIAKEKKEKEEKEKAEESEKKAKEGDAKAEEGKEPPSTNKAAPLKKPETAPTKDGRAILRSRARD